MKIGLVCPYNMFRGGGVQECVFALHKELLRRGHDVKIITPQPRDYEGEVPENMILVGGSTEINSFKTTASVSMSVDIAALEKMLEDEKFEIIHFHEPWVPMLSKQILTRSKAVNVATFHAKLPDSKVNKTIEKVVSPYAKSVIKYVHAYTAVSEASAGFISRLTDAKIEMIPNGVDLKKYKSSLRSKTTQKPETILYIGRLEKRKGVKYLIKAFGLLKATNPNAKLILAGKGPDKEKLEAYVAEKEIKDVEFMGYITEEQKVQLLAESRVFCSPALYGESFGIVLLEGMAMGIPTIAGSNPGYDSVMKERGIISLVDPRDEAEFARRLRVFMEDDGLRQIWTEWALKYVKQFDYSKVVDMYEAVYKSALESF